MNFNTVNPETVETFQTVNCLADLIVKLIIASGKVHRIMFCIEYFCGGRGRWGVVEFSKTNSEVPFYVSYTYFPFFDIFSLSFLLFIILSLDNIFRSHNFILFYNMKALHFCRSPRLANCVVIISGVFRSESCKKKGKCDCSYVKYLINRFILKYFQEICIPWPKYMYDIMWKIYIYIYININACKNSWLYCYKYRQVVMLSKAYPKPSPNMLMPSLL